MTPKAPELTTGEGTSTSTVPADNPNDPKVIDLSDLNLAARGRNGWFTPARAVIDPSGWIELYSARAADIGPIHIRGEGVAELLRRLHAAYTDAAGPAVCGDEAEPAYRCTLPPDHDGPHVDTSHPMHPTWTA